MFSLFKSGYASVPRNFILFSGKLLRKIKFNNESLVEDPQYKWLELTLKMRNFPGGK